MTSCFPQLINGFWSSSRAPSRKRPSFWKHFAFMMRPIPFITFSGILFVIGIATGTLHRGKPALESLPSWIFSAYNMTHSLIVFAVVFLIVFLITKKWFWPMLGWPIHILIDIPTHSTKFFPTRFLWPLANYRFDGISWGTWWFMLLNYSGLIAVYFWIAHSRTK